MTTTWKDKLPFLEASTGVSKNIRGEGVMFYPISAGKIFKLKNLAKPIGKLFATFGKDDVSSTSSETTRFEGAEGEGGGETIKIAAIDPRLDEQRSTRRELAISNLIDEITKDENIKVLGEIIMDSMKEVFPRGDTSNPPATEFINTVDLPALGQMIAGVFDANKELFGPLGGKVQEMVNAKVEQALGDGEVVVRAAGTETPAPNMTIHGATSQTQSNGSRPEGTQPSGSSTLTSLSSTVSTSQQGETTPEKS